MDTYYIVFGSLYSALGRTWQDVDVIRGLDIRDEDGNFIPDNLEEAKALQISYYEGFLKELDTFDSKIETWYRDQLNRGALYRDDTLDSVKKYFREKLDSWLALQKAAIDNGHVLYWST